MTPLEPDGDGRVDLLSRTNRSPSLETVLAAWSGMTGWRFESASAHPKKPRSAGASRVLGLDPGGRGHLF